MICFSLLCHESLECLDDLILNIFKFCPFPCKIVVSVNNFISQEMKTKNWQAPEHIRINPHITEKKLYHSSILLSHVSNFDFMEKKFPSGFYFVPLASNVLFVKKLNWDHFKTQVDAMVYDPLGYRDPNPVVLKHDWHWPKFFANPHIVNFMGVRNFAKGQIEGRVYTFQMAKVIFDLTKAILTPDRIQTEMAFEEIIPATLETIYFGNQVPVVCKVFWDNVDYKPSVQDIQNLIDNEPFLCSVKRVERNMDDPVRKWIQSLS